MKRLVVVLWGACACAWLGSVAAQQQAPATMEIFADCHYIGNKGINDLHAAAAKFNAWADRHNIKGYSAYILTPYAYSDDITADFIWLGTWPNGVAMGGETKTYLAEGAEIRANFQAIAKCRSHGLFATGVVNTPQGPPPDKNGVIVFQNGTLKEGHIASEVFANVPTYVDYLKKHGNDPFMALLFPVAGKSSKDTWSFKAVAGLPTCRGTGATSTRRTLAEYKSQLTHSAAS